MESKHEKPSGYPVELLPTKYVAPYRGNPRIIPEAAIAKVASSIAEFGFRNPILVDASGVVIAGHVRLLAANRLGLEEVPVIVCSDLSDEAVRALRLADNRSAEESMWDEELLANELSELFALHYDLSLTTFEQNEIAELLATPLLPSENDPDALPPAPAEPITKIGDLWILGEHRLLCGDSTKPEDVRRLMGAERAAGMFTDPPYLVNYQGGTHPPTEANGGKQGEETSKHWDAYVDHEHSVDFYTDFLRTALANALNPDAAIYQCYAIMRSEVIWAAWRKVGLLAHQVVIWHKSRAVLNYSWFMWDYEPLLVGWPAGHKPKNTPPADTRAVWEIDSTEGNEAAITSHPTVKPVELIKRPILYHTKPGELIYEPFAGSGTAIIAAEMTGRRCYALELSPAFVDVAVARWQVYSGREAVRRA